MLKAVIFDLDDTLVHRKPSILRYVNRLCADMPDLAAQLPEAKLAELIIHTDNGGYPAPDGRNARIRERVSERLVALLDGRGQVTRVEFEEHWKQFFPRSSVPMPGAEALLGELHAGGTRLAVLSNGSQRSREWTVESLPFGHLVESVYSSGLIGAKKPASVTFEYVLEDMSVDAADACFIGDHPVNDIQGARAVGMQAIWLEGFHPWPAGQEAPALRVKSLEMVSALLPCR